MPGLTMQVQAAQVQTQNSVGAATVTYNGKTFNRASAAYQDGDVSYEGMPLYNGKAEDLDDYVDLIMDEIGVDGWISILAGKSPVVLTPMKMERARLTMCNHSNRAADVGLDGETQCRISWRRHRPGIQIC